MIEPHRAMAARHVALWPHEIADVSIDGRRRVLDRIKAALIEERRRGVQAHWAYDVIRHSALAHCYREELSRLQLPDAPIVRT